MKFDLEKSMKEKPIKDWQLDLFSDMAKVKPSPVKSVEKSLCVLSTPRSGSTLFCEALNSTGLIGHIEEWFNYEYFRAWYYVLGKEDFQLKDYLTWVIEHSVKDTGVFGVHWHIAQVYMMIKDWGFGMNNMRFDECVLIRRGDKIAQSVSMAKAFKSNCFRSYEGKPGEIEITNRDIAHNLTVLTDHEDRIPEFKGFITQTYSYEQFYKDDKYYCRTLRALGKEFPSNIEFNPKTKKQRDDYSVKRTQQFKHYLIGLYQ